MKQTELKTIKTKAMDPHEKNVLIAEFMGYYTESDGFTYDCEGHLENISDKEPWQTVMDDWDSWLEPVEMKFHLSWDWLMPVVNELNSHLAGGVLYDLRGKLFDVDIEGAYNEVVKAIKWHNEHQDK